MGSTDRKAVRAKGRKKQAAQPRLSPGTAEQENYNAGITLDRLVDDRAFRVVTRYSWPDRSSPTSGVNQSCLSLLEELASTEKIEGFHAAFTAAFRVELLAGHGRILKV
jgi:hypothetical protein